MHQLWLWVAQNKPSSAYFSFKVLHICHPMLQSQTVSGPHRFQRIVAYVVAESCQPAIRPEKI